MSYILDALKRADLERTRGAAPDIHAQPMPALAADDEPANVARPWWWIAGGLAVVALALMAWRPWTDATPAQPASADSISGTVAQPGTGPSTDLRAAQPLPSAVPSAAAPAIGAQTEFSAAPPFLPEAKRAAGPAANPAAIAAEPAVPATPAPDPAPAPAAAGAAEAEQAGKAVALKDLPPEIRQQLPAFKLSGSIHSKDAANRMLIVDGQLLHEGDSAAPGVLLERILPRSAVFRFKQILYEVSF